VDLAGPCVIFAEVGAEQIAFGIFSATADMAVKLVPMRTELGYGVADHMRRSRRQVLMFRVGQFEGHLWRDGLINHRPEGLVLLRRVMAAHARGRGRSLHVAHDRAWTRRSANSRPADGGAGARGLAAWLDLTRREAELLRR
jgi:hypothetical protein